VIKCCIRSNSSRGGRGPARANPGPALGSFLVRILNFYVLGPSKKCWPARASPAQALFWLAHPGSSQKIWPVPITLILIKAKYYLREKLIWPFPTPVKLNCQWNICFSLSFCLSVTLTVFSNKDCYLHTLLSYTQAN